MRKKIWGSMALAVAAVAWGTAGCGDNSARCGEGTENVDGVCVGGGGADCGPGTTEVDDQCVPDGSVICEQGTVFDEDAGGCVPDASACAEGTVLVDGQCVPEGTEVDVDHEEAAEPNDGFEADDDIAGQFQVPDVGANGVVLHGCIDPYRDVDGNGNRDIDYDMWLFQATSPMLVEITADGVGGLSAGYMMIPGSQENLVASGWQRFGLNLTGDTSSRQIYLPSAGVYALVMTDGRSLFLTDGAAGSAESCYYTTITQVAVPTPTPLTPGATVTGEHDGDSLFYSLDADEGSFFIGVETLDSAAAIGSLVAVRNGAFHEHNTPDTSNPFADPTLSVVRTGGLHATDTVTYVVEPIYNYALDAVPFTLEAVAPAVDALPVDGTAVTVTNTDGDDLVAYFDVAEDEMYHFDVTSDAATALVFVDEHGLVVTQQETDFDDWIRFPAPGRYHVVLARTGSTPETFDVTSTVESVPITPLPANGTLDNVEFNDHGAAWVSFAPSGETWLAFTANATTWGATVSLDWFNSLNVGVPWGDFGADFSIDLASDGSDSFGHVFFGDPNQYFVMVYDFFENVPDATSTFDLTSADQAFDNLGTVNDGPPVTRDDVTFDASGFELFFVRGNVGGQLTVEVTPTGTDTEIRRLNRNEASLGSFDQGGVDAADTMAVEMPADGWVAFVVLGAEAATFDLEVSYIAPIPYGSTSGNLTFDDICDDTGAVVVTSGDDTLSAAQTMPFAFSMFGFPVTATYRIDTNGYLAFAPGASFNRNNVELPSATSPNGTIAPYWDDLVTTICKVETADTVTIQWTGEVFGDAAPVEFQARLHSNGVIDYVYGPNHTASGGGATVGIENPAGTVGHTYVFNEAGTVAASSSRILSLAP